MSIKFPINPRELIVAIELDAPSVHEILMEECHSNPRGEWLGGYPSYEELITILENYSGNRYETYYWKWRWSMMKELINQNDHDDTVGRDNTAQFLNDMTRIHYGYTLIRCETCDTVHRLYDDKVYNSEVEKWISVACSSCGTLLNHDHPDLFF